MGRLLNKPVRVRRPFGVLVGANLLILQGILSYLCLTHVSRMAMRSLADGAASQAVTRVAWVLAALGTNTLAFLVAAIGMFLLHRWARTLVLVLSGVGIPLSGLGLVILVVSTTQVDPLPLGGLCLVWLMFSVWWMYYLNRSVVKQRFV